MSDKLIEQQTKINQLQKGYNLLEMEMDIEWNIIAYEKRIHDAWDIIFKGVEYMHPKARHDIEIYTKVVERLRERANKLKQQRCNLN